MHKRKNEQMIVIWKRGLKNKEHVAIKKKVLRGNLRENVAIEIKRQ